MQAELLEDPRVDAGMSSSIAVILSASLATRVEATGWHGRTVSCALAASSAFAATPALLRQPRAFSHAVSRLAPIRRRHCGVSPHPVIPKIRGR